MYILYIYIYIYHAKHSEIGVLLTSSSPFPVLGHRWAPDHLVESSGRLFFHQLLKGIYLVAEKPPKGVGYFCKKISENVGLNML